MPATERKGAQRRELIRRRLDLQPAERHLADAAITRAVRQLVAERDSRTIAAFVPHRGEPDLWPALERLDAEGRIILLPVVRELDMHFRRWTPTTGMEDNRFGIPEPVASEEYAPAQLDLALVPLVGFDDHGARLGMGAGFYDRAFSFRLGQAQGTPRLVGVAYAVQHVETLKVDDWDVPLDGVITERGLRWFDAG